MAAKLFRQEALAHQAQYHWGRCTGLAPVGLAVLVWLLAAMTLTGAAFLVTGSYPRKSVVPGILVADQGTIQVRAPVGGMVEQLATGTGRGVEKGEFLLGLRPGILEVNDQPVTRQLLAENRQQELLLTGRLQASSAEYGLRREQLGGGDKTVAGKTPGTRRHVGGGTGRHGPDVFPVPAAQGPGGP